MPASPRRLAGWAPAAPCAGRASPGWRSSDRCSPTHPREGLEPVDKWQDRRMGGKVGEYYLVYFGEAAPAAWPFVLYKQGPVEGMAFGVETLVTWNLTVTPVDGVFTLKRKDDYEFIDRDGRAVALPGKPYLALRLRRLGPTPAPVPVATEPGP